MDRQPVIRTDRIRATEELIAQCRASLVLEIGAGDYSLRRPEMDGVGWRGGIER